MADDDFEFPSGAEEVEEEMDNDADVTSHVPQKDGEERDLVKGGALKKLIVKSGSGWETPEKGDEVKGWAFSLVTFCFCFSGRVLLKIFRLFVFACKI